MTLSASGAISLQSVNVEIGASINAARSLSWVRDNSYFAYKDLSSIHGLRWFQAVSSQNNVSRTTSSTTTACAQACASYDGACYWDCGSACDSDCFNGSWHPWSEPNYAAANASVNCNQCGYPHGAAMLQKDCNCVCNCANCVCNSSACGIPVPNCACSDCG